MNLTFSHSTGALISWREEFVPSVMRVQAQTQSFGLVTLLLFASLSSLLVVQTVPNAEAASGVDLRPIDIEVRYSNNADETRYKSLSSYHPSGTGFNRPSHLFIIDGMLNVSSQFRVTVENQGTTTSSPSNLLFVVEHDEYLGLEIHNVSINIPSISSGSSAIVTTTWTPHYGGNHSMHATVNYPNDDDNSNDRHSERLAIGQMYDTCDQQGQWSFGPNWNLDTDIVVSGSSFNIGSGGISSSHGSNWDRSLTSPVLDFSNAHSNPTVYPKLGFFYTGSGGSGDGIRIEYRDGSQWVNTVNNGFSFDGVVDADLTDGVNWLITNSANRPGSTEATPGFNVPQSVLSSQTQFRMRFISDMSDNGQGYWFEDFVFIYDEVAWPSEYSTSISKGVDAHARRGHWADHIVTINNQGNLTDTYRPIVTGLPSDWDHRFVHMSGSTILPSMDLQVPAGETLSFKVQISPGPNASIGSQSATVKVQSTQQASSSDSIGLTTIVDPDYESEWSGDIPSRFYCLPGNSCEFSVNLTNVGDVADTLALSATQIVQWNDWTFDISFNQQPTVSIPARDSSSILIQAEIPAGETPGRTASIDLTATSVADSTMVRTIRLNLTASMVSDAAIAVESDSMIEDSLIVKPGESVTVPFTVWNNASSQDLFEISFDTTNLRGWNLSLPPSNVLVVRGGDSGIFQVTLTAPSSAQAGDPAPLLEPTIISSVSGDYGSATPFSGIRVQMVHDLNITLVESPTTVSPGAENIISMKVENSGNGPDNAVIQVSGIPDYWDWYVELDGARLEGPISLTPTYEANHIRNFNLIVIPPGGEDANMEVEMTIMAIPFEASDSNPLDNTVTMFTRTERVTKPVLDADIEDMYVRTDSIIGQRIVLLNDGNAFDPNVRIKIESDTIVPGLTSSIIKGGQTAYLGEWLDCPLPPQQNLTLDWLITISKDMPVGTQIEFTITMEGGLDNSGEPQIETEGVTLVVNEHRELSFSHSLESHDTMRPGDIVDFTFNVSSHSSFTEELNLSFPTGETWSIVCNNQANPSHTWMMVIPAAASEEGRSLKWNCQMEVPEVGYGENLVFKVTSDGEDLWHYSQEMDVQKLQLETDGGFLGLGDTESFLPIAILAVGLLFLIFVVGMVTAINRSRSNIVDEEDEEEESPPQVQQQIPPAHQPVTQNQILQQPAPAQTFTDEQFRAAGWTDDKIALYRADELRKATEVAQPQAPIAQVQQPVTQVQWPQATQGQESQQTEQVQTAPSPQPEPVSQQHTQPGIDLGTAFGSLGVPAQTDDEASNQQVVEEVVTEQTPVQESSGAEATNARNLPQINCIHCNEVLTIDVAWIECSSCGSFSHQECASSSESCPRCGHSE